MPTEIYLVKAGMTMTEGTVEEWYVADGATVNAGELLYRLETEKINLDVDADAAGTVRHLVPDGTVCEPGDVVGFIYAPDETIPDVLPSPAATPGAPVEQTPAAAATTAPASTAVPAAAGQVRASPAARRLAAELDVDLATLTGSGPGGRIVEEDVRAKPAAPKRRERAPSSPVARTRAAELGIDIATVAGSGPGGRITKEDVEAAARAPTAAAPEPRRAEPAPAGPGETVPLRGMRKTIAERMFASLHGSAQLTMDMEVRMADSVKLRGQLLEEWSDDGVRVTYTDLVVVAAAKALRAHPQMNASLASEAITRHEGVHVGMAVALAEGLVVPVIRDTLSRSLKDVATESARLAEAARGGTLGLDDLQGGTFTVTSLGMYGVATFTPILNAPQAGILGVGRIYDGVAWEGDTPVRTPMMRLSLTWDHRVLDGAPAAEYLGTVRDYLEQPFRLLV